MSRRTNGLRRTAAGLLCLAVAGTATQWIAATPAQAEEEKCPSVEGVNPDEIGKSELWAQNLMRLEDDIWPTTRGGGVRVAVIDSGVEAGLNDVFGKRVASGKAYIDKIENDKASGGDDATEDCDGHGTEVASIIAGAKTDNQFHGVAPKAEILPIRIANQRPGEDSQDSEEDEDAVVDAGVFAKAIDYAVDNGAKVINLSVKWSQDDSALAGAIDNAIKKDVLVVAAAGNEGSKPNPAPTYPAAYEQQAVLGVGAVDDTLSRLPTSQAGPWVDLVAPGAGLAAPLPDGQYDAQFGATSAATAFVSGSAALLRAQHPKWSADDVAAHLMGTATVTPGGDGKSPEYGYGLVDPYRAVTENLHRDGEAVDTSSVDQPKVSDAQAAQDEFLANAKTWGVWIGLGAVAFFAATLTGVGALRRSRKYGWRVKKVDHDAQVEHFDDGDPIPLFQGIKGLKH